MGSPVVVVDCDGVRFLFCYRAPPWVCLPLGLPSAVAFGSPWGGLLGPCWGLAPFPPGLVLFGVHTRYMPCDRYDSKLLHKVRKEEGLYAFFMEAAAIE